MSWLYSLFSWFLGSSSNGQPEHVPEKTKPLVLPLLNCTRKWKGSHDGLFQNQIYFLTDHFVLVAHNAQIGQDYHTFELIDVFMNRSTEIKFQQSGYLTNLHPLSGQFALITEALNETDLITLVELNLQGREFCRLQAIERTIVFLDVLVDESDRNKFVVQEEDLDDEDASAFQACRLENKSICLLEAVQNVDSRFFFKSSYHDDKLYKFTTTTFFDNETLKDCCISTYDFKNNRMESVTLELLPDHVYNSKRWFSGMVQDWYGGHLFVAVKCKSSGKDTIVRTDTRLHSWTCMEFDSSIPISNLKFVDKHSLMVSATNFTRNLNDLDDIDWQVYKISFGKPEKLRNISWVALVKLLSKTGNTDPHEAALTYVTFNSDIQLSF